MIYVIFVIFELENWYANPECSMAEVQFQVAIATGYITTTPPFAKTALSGINSYPALPHFPLTTLYT